MASQEQGSERIRGYVDAGGLRTYYEVAGEGEPLLLLHGGFGTVETVEAQTSTLASKYRVYVPERRGHGRTPDVEGPFSYEMMAQDTAAFMEALGIRAAHVVGFSDGARVGLFVALERPELVRKLVLIGNYLNEEGARPEAAELMRLWTRESVPPMLKQLYGAVSPDGPDHFGIVFDKAKAMMRDARGVAIGELARVQAQTMILIADDDVVTVEHAAAMQRALPAAQLAVVPGTSHALPMEKPELVNRLILEFLAPEQVPKMLVLADMLAQLRGRAASPPPVT